MTPLDLLLCVFVVLVAIALTLIDEPSYTSADLERRAALQRLLAPTAEAAQALARVGISMQDAALAFARYGDTLQAANAALKEESYDR